MHCAHTTHTRDPSDRAVVKPFLVCLVCGILGVTCDRCARFSPTPAIGYLPDDWCRACDCCPSCCTEVDRGLAPEDIVRAIETATHLVAEGWIAARIRAAATREEAIAIARCECSRGGMSSLGQQVSGFRDRENKGRGLTVMYGHRKGVVPWTVIADYVRAPHPTLPAEQLSLFG